MSTGPDPTEELLRAAVEAARRLLPTPSTRWATVHEYNPNNDQTAVVVDGDTEALPASSATGDGYAVGQRVLVMFTPPNGVHIIGQRPAPPVAYEPELDGIDLDDGTALGEYVIRGGMVDYTVSVILGTAGSVTGDITATLPVPGSAVAVADWLSVARATIGAQRFAGAGVYLASISQYTVGRIGSDGDTGAWGVGIPAAWGPGDALRITGCYPRRLPIEDLPGL